MSDNSLTNIVYTVNKPSTSATHFNGKEERFIYYSMSITQYHMGASPVILSMCDNLGRVLYIEFTDYSAEDCNVSTIENTIKKMRSPNFLNTGNVWKCVATRNGAAEILAKWLAGVIFNNAKACDIPHVQFVTDNPTYTFPILLEIVVGNTAFPNWLSPICISLYQDLPHVTQPDVDNATEEDLKDLMNKMPCPIPTILRYQTPSKSATEDLVTSAKLGLFQPNQTEEDRKLILQYPKIADVLRIRALYNNIWGYTYERT